MVALIGRPRAKEPDHRHRRLLRARRDRPRHRRTAEQRDELAAPHSITSSARARSDGGTSRPSAFAVLRLMTNSNFVDRSTGKLLGFEPLKILSTKTAARRNISGKFTPYANKPPPAANSKNPLEGRRYFAASALIVLASLMKSG